MRESRLIAFIQSVFFSREGDQSRGAIGIRNGFGNSRHGDHVKKRINPFESLRIERRVVAYVVAGSISFKIRYSIHGCAIHRYPLHTTIPLRFIGHSRLPALNKQMHTHIAWLFRHTLIDALTTCQSISIERASVDDNNIAFNDDDRTNCDCNVKNLR